LIGVGAELSRSFEELGSKGAGVLGVGHELQTRDFEGKGMGKGEEKASKVRRRSMATAG